jgi:hypothetical protein
MKKPPARAPKLPASAHKQRAKAPSVRPPDGKIHPVIIYPFRQPGDYADLHGLYELIARLDGERQTYARPITVIDRKTVAAMEGNHAFHDFCKNTVSRHSEMLDAWCVDTCQMWYTGLGRAFDEGAPNDVYWLIPGDFNYGSAMGQEVLSRLHDLPEICAELQQDICIGEIALDHDSSKHLIDTYGTFALLYNWFPKEAREIRGYTEQPRSEFFAVRHGFLREALCQRWYAYEQTMVMLLQAVFAQKHIAQFFVGHISDLPEGRESLPSVMQQIERTERVLKTFWRERHQTVEGWLDQYRELEKESERLRQTAVVTLQNILG